MAWVEPTAGERAELRDRMAALLKHHGRTQRWLEKKIGCATGSISKLWSKSDPRPLTAKFLGELDDILGDGSSQFLIKKTAWHGMTRGKLEPDAMYGASAFAVASRAAVERDRAEWELEDARQQLAVAQQRLRDYEGLRQENGALGLRLKRAEKQLERHRNALAEAKAKLGTIKARALHWEASCFAARGILTAYRDEIVRLLPRYAGLLAAQRGVSFDELLERLTAECLVSISSRPSDVATPASPRIDD